MSPPKFALAGLAAVAVIGAAAAARAADLPILPGWWRWDTQASVAAADLKPDHKMKCLRPRDISKVLSGGINHHYTCRYDLSDIADGRAHLRGVCVDKHGGTVPIELRGAYTPTSFNLKGRLQARFGPLPLPVSARIDAERVSATCPEGAGGEAHGASAAGG